VAEDQQESARAFSTPAGGVTLEALARHLGLSTATVSRALMRPELVARTTRERVQAAAQELGYAPNEVARSLRQRSSRTIGLVISDILNLFHAFVAKGVEDAAAARGYTMFLCNSSEDPRKEQAQLDLLRTHQVRGIILEPAGTAESVEALVRLGMPVVQVDRISGARGVPGVVSDNLGGAATAARYLLDLGHRRIATVAGDPGISSGRERLEGFRAAMAAEGVPLPQRWVATGRYTFDEGYRATTDLFTQAGEAPTALFCANVEMTAGALHALRSLNLRVPDDVSVIGFDDARWALLTDPPLTVVAQDPYALGRRAAEIILDSFDAAPPEAVQVHRLPTRLITRRSCAPVVTAGAPGR
jgi:DNA-binding LacI/PurR family transcriptional regulator